jgi:hypothetical protein
LIEMRSLVEGRPVTGEISPAKVVDEKEEDVGALRSGGGKQEAGGEQKREEYTHGKLSEFFRE